MKRKSLSTIILLLFIIPSIVLAKDICNDNDIKIKSIALKELNGFSEEIQESSINNNTINLNLKMYDVGDSSTYDITVENTSDEDYYFTKDSMKLENDYLEYSLKNDSEVIPAKNEKTIELKVSYKNKIPNESYSDTSKLIISLSDKPLNNPETKMNYTFILILISLIAITIYTKINNKLLSKKKLLLAISFLSVIPISTTALCTVNLNVETKIEIENKEAIFLPGSEVNIKMKELAGDDTSTVTNGYNFLNQNIISIKYSNFEPLASNKEEKNIVSTPDSPYPIYMWFEDGIIYWWSEDKSPSLNGDASYMLFRINSLSNIDGLETFDVSNTTNVNYLLSHTKVDNILKLRNWNTSSIKTMIGTFMYNVDLLNLDGLENWDVSNVTDMLNLFSHNFLLHDVSAIKNWNVSKVESMSMLFACCYELEEIDLSNWKTDSLTDMSYMFSSFENTSDYSLISKLKRIYFSKYFDVSKVTAMNGLFYNDRYIEDYNFLRDWDVSNVTNMMSIFQRNKSLESFEYIKDWNVSKVENMYLLCAGCSKITTLDGLENWDVSSVTTMERMFYGNTNIIDSSAINNWNIINVTNFLHMFYQVTNRPQFTKVQGTWQTNGTFTPSS